MKIKCKLDGAPNLTGFCPPAVEDPQPGAIAVQTPSDAPPSTQDTVHLCTPHVRERVYTATANDNSKPQLPSKPTAYDTDMVNKQGEKLAPWPCSLCLLVGHVELANSYPMQCCHANPQNPNWKLYIAHMRAKDIVQWGHPLPKCLECIN